MAVRKDIALNVLGQIDDYRKSLAQIPGVTDEQAAKAALKLQNRFARAAASQLRQQRVAAKKSQQAWEAMGKAASVAMAAVATAKSVTAIADMRQELADLTNMLGDTSAQTGVSVESLNALRVAAEASGGSLDKLIPGLRQFPKRLSDMALGTGEARIAFEQLGFSQADAKAMMEDTDAAMREVLKRTKEVPDVAKQADIATRIWGESGVILNQVLGDNSIEEWTRAAQGGVDVSEEAIRAGQQWQVDMAILSDRWEGLKQKILSADKEAGSFADGFLVGIAAAIGATQAFADTTIDVLSAVGSMWTKTFKGDFEGAAQEAMKAQVAFSWALSDVTLAGEEAARTFLESRDTMLGAADAARENTRALAKTTQQQQRATQAAQAATRAARERETALSSLEKIRRSAVADTLSGERQIRQAMGDTLREIDALAREGTVTVEEANDVRVEVTRRAQRDIVALERAAAAERQEIAENLANEAQDSLEEANRKRKEQIERDVRGVMAAAQGFAAAIQSVLDSAAASYQAMGREAGAAIDEILGRREELSERLQELMDEERAIAIQLADDTLDANTRVELEKRRQENATAQNQARNRRKRTRAELKANQEIQKDAKKKMKEFVIASRATAIFQIAVNTATAIMTAFAQLGPIAGAIAAVAVGATGVVQAAMVASEPMPSFFSGTSRIAGGPGETMIRAHSGEAVLNSGAASTLGRDIIDSLNAGLSPLQAMGGGGGPVILDGERVGEVMARRARRGGPLRATLRGRDEVGFRNPFGRN